MEYTDEMYKEDLKLATWTYKRNFSAKYSAYKDDLIQVAINQLALNRDKFDESKGTYGAFAIKVCTRKMIRFLELERLKNNLGTNLSIDLEISEDVTLAETIGEEVDFDKNLNLSDLKKQILKILSKPRNRKKLEDLSVKCSFNHILKKREKYTLQSWQKIAIDFFVNGKTEKQLQKELNVTRQMINDSINRARKILQEELKIND